VYGKAAAEAEKATISEIFARVSPLTAELIQYQLGAPNADEEEVRQFIEESLYSDALARLAPDDLQDAERILREYMSRVEGLSQEFVDAEIAELKERNSLQAKATRVLPVLKGRIEKEKADRAAREGEIQRMDEAAHNALLVRLREVLQSPKVAGVELSADDRKIAYAIIANNKVPVRVNGGRTVELGYMDYLSRKQMYGQGGNVENAVFAALVLEKGVGVLKEYLQQEAQKAAVTKVQQQVTGNRFKPAQASPPKAAPDPQEKIRRFASRK
jgi:hypothetical protein